MFAFTHLAGRQVAGWAPDGHGVYVRSREHGIHGDDVEMWHVGIDFTGTAPRTTERLPLGFGLSHSIAHRTAAHFVVGRHTLDTPVTAWKGYRGGRTAHLFETTDAGRTFKRLSIPTLGAWAAH